MKLANYISICSLALCLLSACNSDLEKITYNENAVKPAVLEKPEASYILEAENANQLALTFRWSKPEAGYQAAITNLVEIALAGNGFKNSSVLASGNKQNEAEITVVALNRAILKLLNNVLPAEPVEVEFRVLSSISNAATPFTSNIVKTTIVPYSMEKEYPFIAVRGSYSGWSFANSQRLYSIEENHHYAGMIFFGQGKAAEGWKLCLAENWDDGNWGYSTGANEAAEMTLNAGGGDIKTYSKNSYYVRFNDETGQLQMTKGHNSWGINRKDASPDTELTLSTSTVNGTAVHTLTATVTLRAGDSWRIRPDNNDQDAIAPTDIEHSLPVEGDYFKVAEDGTYIITWIFNKAIPQLSVKKQ